MDRTCGCGGEYLVLTWVPDLAAALHRNGEVVWSCSWYSGQAQQIEGFCPVCGARWVISPMTEAPEMMDLDEVAVRVPGGPLTGGGVR